MLCHRRYPWNGIGERKNHGMTANAFVSVSLDAPLVLVSLDNRLPHAPDPSGRRFVHQRPLIKSLMCHLKPGQIDGFVHELIFADENLRRQD
jgi:Flavin reductase like domain